MRVLFDTNIVLDVILKREPWLVEARALWQANDDGRIVGYISASAITDVFYVARRLVGREIAREAVRTCLKAFEVCVVDRRALEEAQTLSGDDFEDNLQIACASLTGLDAIVTRNKEEFTAAAIPVLTPAELLAQLAQ